MTVFNGVLPGNPQVVQEGDVAIVANNFVIPEGTSGYEPCTGARLYIPPESVASLPSFFVMMVWSGQVLGNTPLEQKDVATAGGWQSCVWDNPIELTPGVPLAIGYSFGFHASPSPWTIQTLAGTTDAIVGPDGVIRMAPTSPNPGWARGLARYGGGGSTVPDNVTLYGVDIVIGDGSVNDPTKLETPVLTVVESTPATEAGNDGSVTATWPPITDAASYEAGIAAGSNQTSDFTSLGSVTSPYTWTGLAPGPYTIAVRALPEE